MSSPQENTYMRGHGIINWNVSKEKQFITREEKLKYEKEQAERKINNKPETQYFKSIKKHFKGNILTKIHKSDSSKST
jgi:hypothetical protein